CSQPLPTVASQSAQFEDEQPVIVHVPLPHEVFALASPWHGWFWPLLAQPPQFCTVCRSTSQPLSCAPSQSAKPESQLPTLHVSVPGSQLVDAVLPSALSQFIPHVPQFLTVFSGVSQPLR